MSDKTNHFNTINRRISWLNDRIAWCQVNDKPFDLYIREREALIWAEDKIRDLSSRLLKLLAVKSEDELVSLRSKVDSLEAAKTKLTLDLLNERNRRKRAEFEASQLKSKLFKKVKI